MSGLTKKYVDTKVENRRVMMFAKSTDPDSEKAKQILKDYGLSKDKYEFVDIEKRQDCEQLENYCRYLCLTDRRQSPYIFIDHHYFGSFLELNNSHTNGSLKQVLTFFEV